MFGCMKKKPKPKVNKPVKPIRTIGPDDNVPFVFVIGHNEGSKGARNYLGEQEWDFNKRIATKAIGKLEELGINAGILFRPKGIGYSRQVLSIVKQAKSLDAKFAFCMHFNDASSLKAAGCEVLIESTRWPEDSQLADFITDELNEKYGFKERHDDGIKIVSRGHNGYGMIHGLNNAGLVSVLLEPCFARNKKESKHIFEKEDNYVDILVDAVFKLVTGNLPQVD